MIKARMLEQWQAPALGGPERVMVSCCPLCHEPADKTMTRKDGGEWNWCEGCRLDWYDDQEGRPVTHRALGRRGRR
jgi:hypothetical protein